MIEAPPPLTLSMLALPAFVAAAVAATSTPLLRRFALWIGAVDEPSTRRVHSGSIPRLGGVALFLAVVAAFAVVHASGNPVLWIVVSHQWSLAWSALAVTAIVAVGIADDVFPLGPVAKLGGQGVATALALAGGYGFDTVTNPFTGAPIDLGFVGPLASIAWILLITNAFNLIDGLDGLASGIALIACMTIAVVAATQGRPDAVILAVVLGAALVGFLPFNFHPATIFLGDSGSLLLGFWLALLSVQGLQKGTTLIVVLVPLLTLGIPLLDTGLSIVRRTFVSGWATIFHADRDHVHHRLLALGLNHRNAVLALYAGAALLGLLAFSSLWLSGPGNAVLVAVVGALLFAALRKLGYHRRD